MYTPNNSLSNKYYVYLKGDQEPISWNASGIKQKVPECNYFGQVFKAMEKNLEASSLVFYFTNDTHRLPSYGQNIVAVVIGDEWCRIPAYFYKVRAVFKCYGTRPTLGCNPFLKPSYLNFLTLIQFLRNWIANLPGLLNYKFHKSKSWVAHFVGLSTTRISPVYDIPLGYLNQIDLPIKGMEARLYDIFFNGSVVHVNFPIWSSKNWFGTPKKLAREKMVSSASKVEEKHPELKVKLSITSSFSASWSAAPKSYSEEMMNAKICLVPRGATFETFRFFEALRYGCIVVTEALPSRWFYNESPAIQITDWSELEGVLENLISDKRLMQEKHQASLNWWKTKCSEAAVGVYIAKKLNATQSA